MATVLYIILAIVVLLFMVLIHEFGHYVVGRMLGFKITEFSVGFGKALFSRKNKRGEVVSLRIFPLGGFCAFEGENGEGEESNPDAFTNQAPWKRILVFLAGVTFNFATAVIFSIILLCSVGYDIPQAKQYVQFDTTQIANYVDGSYTDLYHLIPEEERLQEGDVIISVNGQTIDFAYGTTYQEQFNVASAQLHEYLYNEVKDLKGMDLINGMQEAFENYQNFPTARVKRDGKYVDVKFAFYSYKVYVIENGGQVPLIDEETNLQVQDEHGNLQWETVTIYSWNSYMQNGPYVHSFGEAVERAVPFSCGMAWTVLKSLWQLITFQLDVSEIGGPITTITTIASTTQANPLNLLILIPLISANLAIFNALPIPALDGSHVIFTFIEWIRKKPIKRDVENMIHLIGIFALFAFVILIDILHFVL
ncbi:MAG: site-2 protease family protein [Clostridia bacterium]|nr:site-2 protease family protein [Clostridia bacterium]